MTTETEMGTKPPTEGKPRQVNAVFCPQCGVPRSIPARLQTMFARNKLKKLRFQCLACGLKLTFELGWPKADPSFELSVKDIVSGAKAAKSLVRVLS